MNSAKKVGNVIRASFRRLKGKRTAKVPEQVCLSQALKHLLYAYALLPLALATVLFEAIDNPNPVGILISSCADV